MDDCKATLESMEHILESVHRGRLGGGLLRRPWMQIKLDMKSADIALLKQHLSADFTAVAATHFDVCICFSL